MTVGSRLTCQASIRPELSVKLRAEVGVVQRIDGIKGNLESFPQSLVSLVARWCCWARLGLFPKQRWEKSMGTVKEIEGGKEGRSWNVSESGLL